MHFGQVRPLSSAQAVENIDDMCSSQWKKKRKLFDYAFVIGQKAFRSDMSTW